jgi:hypothetical protein
MFLMNKGTHCRVSIEKKSLQPNQQLKLTESADCVKHCLCRFRLSLKAFIMNLFSSVQLWTLYAPQLSCHPLGGTKYLGESHGISK